MADAEELELRLKESQAQLKEAQSRLERAEKLAAVGGLVSEIAHEISTPLAALQCNTDTLAVGMQRLKGLIGEARSGMREIDELFQVTEAAIQTNRVACDRIWNIVRGLRSTQRPDRAGFVRSDVQREIDDSTSLLAHAFRSRVRLVKDYGALPEIDCDPGRLGQVFLNLLINAVQAIEGEGEIRIRTWKEGDTVRVEIRDTGKGISAEIQPRIFDPGFTTKGGDKGTGLGLTICRRIVQQHGGRIDVESETGRGATFTVILPLRQPRERMTDEH